MSKEKFMTDENYEPRCITCKFAIFLAAIWLCGICYFYGADVGRELARQEKGRCK